MPQVSLPTRIFRGDLTQNLRISQNLSIPGIWGINGTSLTPLSNFLNFFQFSTSPVPPGALLRVPAASQNGTRTEPYHVGCHWNLLDTPVNFFKFFPIFNLTRPPRSPLKGPGSLSKWTFPDLNRTLPCGVSSVPT